MTYEFADRLIELRKDNGMSQEELAQRIGLSRQAVSKWERAESSPDIGNLVALAEIYGLTIDDIVKGTSAVSPETDEEASSEAEAVAEEVGEEDAEEAVEEVAYDETEVLEDVEVDVAADSADSQPSQPTDDVSQMPPPDPSQRVDWMPPTSAPSASDFASTQAPPPGHPFGGHQGVPDPSMQHFATPGPAQSDDKARKPPALMFPYPVLCALLYLILGFAFGLWHPCWIVFLTIPFYYWIVNVVVNDPLWRARHGYLDE